MTDEHKHIWVENKEQGGKICTVCKATRGCTWPNCYCDTQCPDEWVKT